jgi:PhoH-like ATPase
MTVQYPAEKKLFVLETNVILHTPHCIRDFAENDIAIPITVLEQLNRFKRGNEDLHFQARQFLRDLDEMSGPDPNHCRLSAQETR